MLNFRGLVGNELVRVLLWVLVIIVGAGVILVVTRNLFG
jgi:hypothetical protein